MLLSVLLGFALCRGYGDREEELLETISNSIDELLDLDDEEMNRRSLSLRDAMSGNRRISQREVEKFISFLEKRKQKKQIKKILEKLLKKRGLDKITGKKFQLVQKGCRLAKTRCLRAEKMARRAASQ